MKDFFLARPFFALNVIFLISPEKSVNKNGGNVTHTRERKDGNQCMTRSRREHAYADNEHNYTSLRRLGMVVVEAKMLEEEGKNDVKRASVLC